MWFAPLAVVLTVEGTLAGSTYISRGGQQLADERIRNEEAGKGKVGVIIDGPYAIDAEQAKGRAGRDALDAEQVPGALLALEATEQMQAAARIEQKLAAAASFMMANYGVLLAICSAAVYAVGVNLQRLAKLRGWMVAEGIGLLMVSALCPLLDVSSFALAPQALLAPFWSIGLVLNLLLAPLMAGDMVTVRACLCTLVVVIGLFVCLRCAPYYNVVHTPAELMQMANRPQFLIFLVLQSGVFVGFALTTRKDGKSSLAAIAIAMCHGICAGTLMLCAKVLTQLQTSAPVASLGIIFVAVNFAVGSVLTLNWGLARHSALVLLPVGAAVNTLYNACVGWTFYDEFIMLTRQQTHLYWLGLGLLLSGVVMLTTDKMDHPKLRRGDLRSRLTTITEDDGPG